MAGPGAPLKGGSRRRSEQGIRPSPTASGSTLPPPPESSSPPKPVSKRQRRATKERVNGSFVWRHVDCFTDSVTGFRYALCRHCSEPRTRLPRSSTAKHLKANIVLRHLRATHPELVPRSKHLPKSTRDRYNRAIAVGCIVNHWPLRTPRSLGMRTIAKVLADFEPCSTETMVKRHMRPLYDSALRFLCGSVKAGCFVQLFIDGWSSNAGPASAASRDCFGVCGTFVTEDFTRMKLSLALRHVEGTQSADVLESVLTKVMEDFSLPASCVMDIASDNESTETAVVTSMLSLCSNAHQTRCFCHTLHLAVGSLFSEVSVSAN